MADEGERLMADRVKRTYRGRTYYAKSSRPGKKSQRVKSHCRRPSGTVMGRILAKLRDDRDMPF